MVRSAGTHEHFTQGSASRPHGNPQAILGSLWLLIWLPLAALWRPWPPLTLIGQSLPALARAVTPLAALPRKSMPRRCLVRVRQLVRIGCRSGQERCQLETHRASAGKALATMDKMKVYKEAGGGGLIYYHHPPSSTPHNCTVHAHCILTARRVEIRSETYSV